MTERSDRNSPRPARAVIAGLVLSACAGLVIMGPRGLVLAQADQAESGALQQPSDAAGPRDAIAAAIRRVLQAQERAWNAGDVEAFMAHYWKSDDLTFSSGGQTTRSWQGTLDRYKKRYPTRAAMGQTTFKNLEITPLGTEAALVLGEWQLRREGETIGGNFTLVFRRLDDQWVIIHDHTSQASGTGVGGGE